VDRAGAIAPNGASVQRVEALSVTDDLSAYNSRFSQVLRERRAMRAPPLSLFIDLMGSRDQRHARHLYGSRALVEAAG
jgi:hypothetical protein